MREQSEDGEKGANCALSLEGRFIDKAYLVLQGQLLVLMSGQKILEKKVLIR